MYCGVSIVVPQVGPDSVHVALSLVEYKPELQKAMEFVFGTTFVCDNMDNAKKVAFDKRIMTRTVTLGGDVFDPHGTLSGGKFYSLLSSQFFVVNRKRPFLSTFLAQLPTSSGNILTSHLCVCQCHLPPVKSKTKIKPALEMVP